MLPGRWAPRLGLESPHTPASPSAPLLKPGPPEPVPPDSLLPKAAGSACGLCLPLLPAPGHESRSLALSSSPLSVIPSASQKTVSVFPLQREPSLRTAFPGTGLVPTPLCRKIPGGGLRPHHSWSSPPPILSSHPPHLHWNCPVSFGNPWAPPLPLCPFTAPSALAAF